MPVSALTLSTAELKAALHATEGENVARRTLAWWAETGIVTPSVQQSPSRSGGGNIYTVHDLARARLLLHLRRNGLSMQQCRIIFAVLEQQFADVLKPNTTAALVVDGHRAYVVRPGEPDIEVPSGQLRLQLSKVWKGTERAARMAKRAA